MGESFPDGGKGVPLYNLCSNLNGEIFPRARARLVGVLYVFLTARPGSSVRFQKAEVLLRRLRGLRSDRQLERYLAERVAVKDLISFHWATMHFLHALAEHPVDTLGFQRARQLIGRKPTRLKFLRAALRFWIEQE
jgi:hypothetical protein